MAAQRVTKHDASLDALNRSWGQPVESAVLVKPGLPPTASDVTGPSPYSASVVWVIPPKGMGGLGCGCLSGEMKRTRNLQLESLFFFTFVAPGEERASEATAGAKSDAVTTPNSF